MLNYKLERVVLVILWLGVLVFFSIVIPPQTVTLLIQYQYSMSSAIITGLIFYIYRRISNRIFLKKVDDLVLRKETKMAIEYVTIALKKQPRFYWLRVKKLELLLLDGNVSEFQTLKTVTFCKKESLKKYIEMMDNIVCYFRQNEIHQMELCDDIDKESSILVKTNYLLCKKDDMSEDALIYLSSEIFNSSILIYRCVASIVLSFHYKKTGDKINQLLYYEKAISNAPSVEIKYCIDSIFNAG